MGNIIVIGSLNYDIILKIPHFPKIGETLMADSTTFSAGGKGANQAAQAAKLGAETHMIGCVGTDYMGDFLVKSADKCGVITDGIRRTNISSGMSAANSMKDGSVFAAVVRGANFEVSREDVDKAAGIMTKDSLLILQMEIPMEIMEYAIKVAKAHQTRIFLNAAPAAEIGDEYLAMCDTVVVNEVEAEFYSGRVVDSIENALLQVQAFGAKYHNNWIITLGSVGSVILNKGVPEFIKAVKVHAIESTGAGDSYIGATAYGIQNGMSLKEACEFASYCSALTVCNIGAQDSMPTLNRVIEFKNGRNQ